MILAILFSFFLGGCFGWPVGEGHREDRPPRGRDTDAFWRAENDGTDVESAARDGFGAQCTPETLLFQQGVKGYDAAVDIEVREKHPDTAYPQGQRLSADLGDSSSTDTRKQVFLRFDDIFGKGVGQIPDDAEVTRASLRIWVTNPSEDHVTLYRMLYDWHGDDTWSDLAGRAVNEDIRVFATADAVLSSPDTAEQTYTFDVTASLLAWLSNPSSNFGWVFINGGDDGLDFASSEYGIAARRPALEVELACGHAPEVELRSPADRALEVATTSALRVTVEDPGGGPLDVVFYGRERSAETWTLIALPDTQYYTSTPEYNEIFAGQTKWIVDNQRALNIRMVVHEGDIVNNWDVQEQWDIAHATLSLLRDNDIPFAPIPGNHDHAERQWDGDTFMYSSTFPASDFEPFPWWEEDSDYHDNANNTVTLTIGEERYLFIGLDFCPSPDEIEWADDVLNAHPEHKAILTTHAYIRDSDGAYTGRDMCPDTSYIFDDLVDHHDNLQLVLCGHSHDDDGEYYRPDTNANAVLVHQLVADYQGRESGGGGLLRIMTFDPNDDEIRVQTYSPYTDAYETDADSDFTLPYEMEGGEDFVELGIVTGVPSGGDAGLSWSGLRPERTYEWYVEVKGERGVTRSPAWRWTTADACTDCDDGNRCTDDACIHGTCVHADNGACDAGDASEGSASD